MVAVCLGGYNVTSAHRLGQLLLPVWPDTWAVNTAGTYTRPLTQRRRFSGTDCGPSPHQWLGDRSSSNYDAIHHDGFALR